MKKMVLATSVGILALGAVAVWSQPVLAAGGRGAGAAQSGQLRARLAKLATYLQLTDGQKAQIKPLIRGAVQQARAIRQDTSLTSEQQRAKIMALRQTVLPQIMGILTPEQHQKITHLRERRAAHKG